MMSFKNNVKPDADENFSLRTFSSDVVIFTIGQILLLILGFIQFFIIPKYLTVEDYGYLKLFMLFASYVGVLHLGFSDGVYVCWAGKKLVEIGDEIKTAIKFLLFEQVIVLSLLALIFCFILNQLNFIWIALTILLYAFISNLAAFLIFSTQAIKKFKLLTLVNITSGLSFLFFIIVFFLLQQTSFYYVILSNLISLGMVICILTIFFRRYLFHRKKSSMQSSWKFGIQKIRIGVFVLCGNLVVVFFSTFDQFIVSSFFPIQQFAIYAFALTGTSIIYTLIGAISQVLFPYLSSAIPKMKIRIYTITKSAIILIWAVFLIVYFPLLKVIQYFLSQYISSVPIIQIMLCTIGFGGVIQIIHTNYYKAYRKQRQYFIFGIFALIFAILLAVTVAKIWGSLENIAIATLIGFGVWYVINELNLKSVLEQSNKEIGKTLLIICSYIAAFLFSSFISDFFIYQMLIYLGFFFLITYVALRLEARELLRMAKKLRRERI